MKNARTGDCVTSKRVYYIPYWKFWPSQGSAYKVANAFVHYLTHSFVTRRQDIDSQNPKHIDLNNAV